VRWLPIEVTGICFFTPDDLNSGLHWNGRKKRNSPTPRECNNPRTDYQFVAVFSLEVNYLIKEGRVKRIVSIVFLVTICIFAGSAFAVDHGSFMIVPISCNKTTGDAVASDVLVGKTFSNKYAVGVPGAMPNVGKQVVTPTTFNQTITKGYHDGSGMVVGDGDLKNIYILKKIDIFGVTGSLGVFWGCRTGTDSWNSTLCGVDCIQFSALGAVGCTNLCNGIYNLITASLPYNVGGFICGGTGGL
jgi:hypothetical protein